jgi:hypothetical protein
MDAIREQWLILVSTPIYCLIIGIELLLSHLQQRKTYTLRNTVSNVYLMLLNGGLDLAFRLVTLAVLGYFFQQSLIHWNHDILYPNLSQLS